MPLKKTVAIAVSLSMIANLSPHVYASDLVAFPQNNTSVIIPPNSSIVQSNSTEFSMKSIEDKINNVLNPVEKEESKQAELLDASGSCGTNLIYTFTASTGELKIFGSGAMTSYSHTSSVPWYSYKSSIKSVTIGNDVTSIGSYAFSGCSRLTSITIPDSVNSIGDYAFRDCFGLNFVTYEGTYEPGTSSLDVFPGCNQLTEVNVPYNYQGSSFCGLSINRMPEPEHTQTTPETSTKGSSKTALIASAFIVASSVITSYFIKSRS